MTDTIESVTDSEDGRPLADLKLPGDTPIAPAHGIAAIALHMSMKYHDMGMVKDGVLYQQYKMEGKNFRVIGLNDVFETAIRIEQHLLGASERIAKLVVDAITVVVDEDEEEEEEEENSSLDTSP